jgi:hypothetical protein
MGDRSLCVWQVEEENFGKSSFTALLYLVGLGFRSFGIENPWFFDQLNCGVPNAMDAIIPTLDGMINTPKFHGFFVNFHTLL